ncbi:MAG TPA: GyrI-like domain-containing protein [Symbiobacteriaceae bacterium]|nr:GyrI-like domain-containing protein [Symbiobacteriaceae bacterium]
MISVRIEERPAFRVVGRKTWIGGVADEAAFGRFWDQCREDGLLGKLHELRGGTTVTGGHYVGVSRVEADPANRSFYFYVAVESDADAAAFGLEEVLLPASKWAVFQNRGPMPQALVAAEMYAFTQWLPASGLVHDAAPEMEVYPPGEGGLVEFWLPVRERD